MSYVDADEAVGAARDQVVTSYDGAERVHQVADAHTTLTYTYNGGTEHPGLTTSLAVAVNSATRTHLHRHLRPDDGSEDSPDWIAENADSTQWTANVSDLLGSLGLTVSQDGTANYQYANIHGDITCTASAADTTPTISPDYDE